MILRLTALNLSESRSNLTYLRLVSNRESKTTTEFGPSTILLSGTDNLQWIISPPRTVQPCNTSMQRFCLRNSYPMMIQTHHSRFNVSGNVTKIRNQLARLCSRAPYHHEGLGDRKHFDLDPLISKRMIVLVKWRC